MRYVSALLIAALALAAPAEARPTPRPVVVHHKPLFTGVVHIKRHKPAAVAKPKAKPKPKARPKPKPRARHRRVRRRYLGS